MKKIAFLSIALSALILSACAQDEIVMDAQQGHNVFPITEKIGLSPDVEDLSVSDAKIVATIFKNKGDKSRSMSEQKISGIVTIPGNDGKPALYAVNFENGYIIVSATRMLDPILAIVNEGTFSLEDEPFGRDVLISEMKDNIEYLKNHPEKKADNISWRQYLKREPSDIEYSRAASDNDPWYVQSEKMYELELQGYSCYRITKFEDEQEIMPDNILQRFKNRARFEDGDNIWEEEWGEGFIYNTAFIAIKDYNTNDLTSRVGPLLTTTWNQRPYYNYMIGSTKPLGCVTIAVAQLMKYYQYPNYFNWSAMPNKLEYGYECPLTSFLAQLHDELGVSDDGGTTDDKAESVLKKYGYNVQKKKHQTGSYYIPSYCSGAPSSLATGHAWVCDGYSSTISKTDYELYILETGNKDKFQYTLIDKEEERQSHNFYYMNWGWGGKHDGGYSEYGLYVNGTNYNSRRTDIIITKPK